MATYTPAEIADAMRRAGFDESKIREGVAIVFAESGGRSEATNKTSLENSLGPWQLNLLAHPDVSEGCARDLVCSTEKAFKMSGGGSSWTPWGAFTNGSYAKYLHLFDSTTSPNPAGDGGAKPNASLSPAGLPSCGLDAGTISAIGDYLRSGMKPQEIADLLTKHLGRPITVDCMRGDAYRAADDIGKAIDAAAGIPVLGGIAQGVAGGAGAAIKFGDLLKPENLWRAFFIVGGAAMVYLGLRLYLREEPSGVSYSPQTQASTPTA